MIVLDPGTLATIGFLPELLRTHNVGAVFTTQAFLPMVPPDVPFVVLDDAPRRAMVSAYGRESEVDLGTHFALDLIGDTETPSSPEECLRLLPSGEVLSHADILDEARRAMRELRLTPLHHTAWTTTPVSFGSIVRELVAPLLVGGTVSTGHAS